MNDQQFKEFITAFTNQQNQFFEKLLPVHASNYSNSNVNSENVQINPVLLHPFECFDSKKETFKNYIQRFENYLKMKNIFSDKKFCAQMFLNSIGALNYNMLSALVSPKSPSELSYSELIKAFEEHLCPKKNVIVSQHKFLSTYQGENQSIPEYIAELRRDIVNCEFISPCECKVSIADIFLRAQFIRGIYDSTIREHILQSDANTFDEICKKAIVLEVSRMDNLELSKNSKIVSSTNESNVSAIKKISKHRNSRIDSKDSSFQRSSSRSKTHTNQRSKSRSRIDYEKLGINNLCLRCGKAFHTAKTCRSDRYSLNCSACNGIGHVAKVCIRTLLSEKGKINANKFNTANYITERKNFSQYGVNKIIDVFQNTKNKTKNLQKYFVTVNIENHKIPFEVDSGTAFTFIPREKFRNMNLPVKLQNTTIAFRSYTGDVFLPDGKATVKVEYNGKTIREEMYVVPNNFDALLGRSWIRSLGICLQRIDSEESENLNTLQINTIETLEDIISKYPEIFEQKVGCIPDVKVSLKLRENCKPVFHKAREVPYALREKVDKELDTLEAQGVISKVPTSDWGSPLVVIPKADGNVRLCVDYKVGVNERLVSANYPIQRVDEILHSLRNSKYFCRLDLFKAYLHVLVDEESSVIQTISTHRGTYRMNRLSFGIKTAPSDFNRILDQILQNLTNTIKYYDDIIVHGKTKEECRKYLEICLQQLKKYDLHLNRSKCVLFQEKIEYLGHVIEHNTISKSPEKVRAIVEMPRPSNVEDLRRFLGMVTYYSRFLPDISTVTYPLRQLLRKNCRFRWTTTCEAAFIKLKTEISNERTLVPYDPTLPIMLSCDASPVGIAGILSHVIEGQERTIAFASRSLTSAEQNYSQLDREALAIVFSINHFFNYLYGRHFKLATDNRPLTRIFHPTVKLPPMTSGRLLRYASFLSAFDYEVVFKKGSENIEADCLSRAPVVQKEVATDMAINNEINEVCMTSVNAISTELLNFKSIQKETDEDEELSKIKKEIEENPERSFEFTLEEGILFKAQRIIIPKTLQKFVLQELHRTHVGTTKMKQLARRYVYWKGIDRDIERLSRTCESCVEIKKNPSKVPVHPWDEPKENWDRIHIDYAGPFQDHFFLIVIDAKSKWAEIKICRNSPTTASTIEMLADIFSTHGFPRVMVSDNASIFQSEQFKLYCSKHGIFQKFIAPGHPATNGLAERHVQILKTRLKAMTNEPLSMHTKVREILFRYRATPLSSNKTPAEMYLQRNIRIQLDAIRPAKYMQNVDRLIKSRQLNVGERVQVRWYNKNEITWKLGTVMQKYGRLHYKVKLDNGYIFKRHINQLRRTEIQKKTVSFAPDTKSGDSAEESDLLQPLWRRPPDSATVAQYANDYNKSNRPIQPRQQHRTEVVHRSPIQHPRRSTRHHRPPSYLQNYVLN